MQYMIKIIKMLLEARNNLNISKQLVARRLYLKEFMEISQ